MADLNMRALWRTGRTDTHDDTDSIRDDPRLGALGQLKGTWRNAEGFEDRLWNLIALPFGPPDQFPSRFRLLLNQADERLRFSVADLGVANRGLDQHDQHLAALLYLQEINQVMAVDAASDATGGVKVPATQDTNDTPKGNKLQPVTGVHDPNIVGIHRESGLFLHLGGQAGPCDNSDGPGPDIARLASIPHGDSVLAMGFDGAAPARAGPPDFAAAESFFNPLPIGLDSTDLGQPFLAPYNFFDNAPFKGNVVKPGFKGFNPIHPLGLLESALDPTTTKVIETTTLRFDSEIAGHITNIPFVICQANATKVTAFFWIQRVEISGVQRFILQYAQRVLLEFFERRDGEPGLIRWPHITINTLIRA